MYNFLEICKESLAKGLEPEPELTVSEWAAAHRMLEQNSAEPGPWRNERTPYLVEIMDCLSPFSGIEFVSVMKGAQVGLTEAGNNWIGAIIDCFPGPTLYVQPTVDTVKKYSRMRLSPMIASCPTLKSKIGIGKSRESSNTIFLKEFPGGSLILGGANSAAGLRSMPIRYLFLDEVDAYPLDVDGEGSPIQLAEKRTNTFRNRKIFKISTPTIAGLSHIETAFENGDQRQYFVPCPHCGKMFVFRWRFSMDATPGGLVWDWGKPQTAMYQCPHCSKLIPEFQKTRMNIEGVWVPTEGKGGDPRVRSYHISSMYSPYGWPGSSWPELAKRWEKCHKDPTGKKEFFNLELGLPWEDAASKIAEPDSLMERCEEFPGRAADGILVIPDKVVVVTVGADVQNDRIEYEIVGWGNGEESWSLDKGIIPGDTSTFAPYMELDKVINQKLRNETGVGFQIHAACIDCNFNTQTATSWCGPRFHKRVWAVRGAAGKRAIWPRLPGKTKHNSTPLFTIGVDAAKEAIVGRLTIVEEGPGYSHFPTERASDRDYFDQITSEICVTIYDKIPPYNVWRKKYPSARNEALDVRVYAYGALCGLIASGLRLEVEDVRLTTENEKRKAQLKPIARPLGTFNGNRASRFQMERPY